MVYGFSCKDYQEIQYQSLASSARVRNCMKVIAFTTQEAAHLLFDPDDTFADQEKEAYFVKREGERLSD